MPTSSGASEIIDLDMQHAFKDAAEKFAASYWTEDEHNEFVFFIAGAKLKEIRRALEE